MILAFVRSSSIYEHTKPHQKLVAQWSNRCSAARGEPGDSGTQLLPAWAGPPSWYGRERPILPIWHAQLRRIRRAPGPALPLLRGRTAGAVIAVHSG